MKKFFAIALAAALSVSLFACSGSTSSAGQSSAGTASSSAADASSSADAASFTTVEAGKLHMSTNAAFPPYEMTTDNGGFEGIDVEIATAIAEKLGLELVVDDMGFDAALTAVQTGQSDIAMAGITVNEDRLELMDFSDSYATGVQVIIVKEDSPIETVDD
jgi:polar amino acid transport system substrate-binding protein